MNRKSMILFIIWVALCIGLVVFMIIHIIIQQHAAISEQSKNSLIVLGQLLFGGKLI